jgi:hypothetical protein
VDKQVIQKISYTHDAVIDLIIGSPGVSQGTLAAHFGYTQGWLSQVMGSDAFQARLASRREEIIDPTLVLTIEEKIKGMAHQSLEVLQKKLSAPIVSDNTALKAFELSSRALGYGAQTTPQTPLQPLEKLAENITLIFNQKTKGETYEHILRTKQATDASETLENT